MSFDRLTDQELKQILHRCLSQNEEAWEELFKRLHGIIRHSINKTGLREEDALDAEGETYLRIISAIEQIAAAQYPLSYIGAMARYTALRAKQQKEHPGMDRHRTPSVDEEWEIDLPAPLIDGQAAKAQVRRFQEHIVRAFSKLSPVNRSLIRLKYIEELCYEEISYIDGRDCGALRVAVHRAVRELRTHLPDQLATEFHESSDLWCEVANIELPHTPAPIGAEEDSLLRGYIGCREELTADEVARVERALAERQELREHKVKLERDLFAREDVRGHEDLGEIPGDMLSMLMERVRQTRIAPKSH